MLLLGLMMSLGAAVGSAGKYFSLGDCRQTRQKNGSDLGIVACGDGCTRDDSLASPRLLAKHGGIACDWIHFICSK